jgi:hypothetical protein
MAVVLSDSYRVKVQSIRTNSFSNIIEFVEECLRIIIVHIEIIDRQGVLFFNHGGSPRKNGVSRRIK